MNIKQRVNLYQAELHIRQQLLTLPRLLLALLGLLTLIIVLWFVQQQQTRQFQLQLSDTQQQLNTVTQELSLYQQALAQRQPSETLQLQLQQLKSSVLQKQQLIGFLSGQQQQATVLFSPVLQHLQQIDRQALWLTSFTLQPHYSSFNGIALQPEVVPLWLTDLSKLTYFSGQRFNQLELQQVPDKTAVSFSLTAQPEVQ